MKYSIDNVYHCDKNVFKKNKLGNRSYFIPFDNRVQAESSGILYDRKNSPRVYLLNDGWKFKYYSSYGEMPKTFESEELGGDTVSVPSTWQRTGYEKPCYLNSRYEFPMRPPVIDCDVPVGVYYNSFVVTGENKRRILTFLGVCSCVSLYVNGNFTGYAEGSHDMNEFDISEYVVQGNNEIVAIVTKFSCGSYLECQDMFRENGIFRDVYITEYYLTDIYDFAVDTVKNKDGSYDLLLSADIDGANDKTYVKAELTDIGGNAIASALTPALKGEPTNLRFENLNVKEWSAEIPNLYSLYITLLVDNEALTCVRQQVGFKTVEIKGDVFLVNGKPVKLLGVNHHDTDAENGWVMTAEQLERDVKIMKDFNVNAVRMSHYPPDPILITLCDIHGLYVIDEADIECHGIYSNPLNQRFGRISNNLYWKDQFIERVDNMFRRDRNHASIIMWSLGNESGGYKCHDIAYMHLKSLTGIPVHYEGVIHTMRHSYDVASEMYAHTPHVKAIGEKKADERFRDKPYFLCEYAHAMGVGPGSLDEYVNLFFSYDNLMGGCIWEFADHAVYDKDARYKYTYGGDHGEKKHDGNFCVDGLFHTDRSPGSGALTMRAAYRPIVVVHRDKSVFSFRNRRYFKSSDDIIIRYRLMNNGVEIRRGEIDLDIPPESFKDYDIGIEGFDLQGDVYVIFNYIERESGREIASEQAMLKEAQYPVYRENANGITLNENKLVYTIKYKGGSIIYDANNGELVSFTVNNVELMNQDPSGKIKGLSPSIYRAEIDNDRFIKILWNFLGYSRSRAVFKRAKVYESGGAVVINSRYLIKGLGNIAKCDIDYRITGDGSIEVKVRMSRAFKLILYSDIPRMGVSIELPKELENIEYYGLGPNENLSDMRDHAVLDIYENTVQGMEEFYIKPQDSGNRGEVRYVKLTRSDGAGIAVTHAGNYLNFRVKRYALSDILGKGHIEDVEEKDTTVLYIDGFYRGAGSQSCGPQPFKEFRPNLKKPLEFSFVIKAISND